MIVNTANVANIQFAVPQARTSQESKAQVMIELMTPKTISYCVMYQPHKSQECTGTPSSNFIVCSAHLLKIGSMKFMGLKAPIVALKRIHIAFNSLSSVYHP